MWTRANGLCLSYSYKKPHSNLNEWTLPYYGMGMTIQPHIHNNLWDNYTIQTIPRNWLIDCLKILSHGTVRMGTTRCIKVKMTIGSILLVYMVSWE